MHNVTIRICLLAVVQLSNVIPALSQIEELECCLIARGPNYIYRSIGPERQLQVSPKAITITRINENGDQEAHHYVLPIRRKKDSLRQRPKDWYSSHENVLVIDKRYYPESISHLNAPFDVDSACSIAHDGEKLIVLFNEGTTWSLHGGTWSKSVLDIPIKYKKFRHITPLQDGRNLSGYAVMTDSNVHVLDNDFYLKSTIPFATRRGDYSIYRDGNTISIYSHLSTLVLTESQSPVHLPLHDNYRTKGLCPDIKRDVKHIEDACESPAGRVYVLSDKEIISFMPEDKLVEENHATIEMSVYPTPTNSAINFTPTIRGQISVVCIDVNAKAVYSTTMWSDGSLATIDVSSLANGSYSLMITDGKEVSTTTFLVSR